MDTESTETTTLQEQLSAKNFELSQLAQLSAKPAVSTDELSHVKSQVLAGASVLEDLKLVTGACGCHTKRAK